MKIQQLGKFFFSSLLLLALSSILVSGQTTKSNKMTDDTVTKLEKADVFAIGPVGYAGTISESEIFARRILSQPTADAAFQTILQNGSMAAKMYALWALRKIHGRESTKYFAEFQNSSLEVQTMSGCMRGNEKVSDVVKEIESPYYLQFSMKTMWTMDLEKRREMITKEEETILLSVFRAHKSAGTLNEIADKTFGEILQSEYNKN